MIIKSNIPPRAERYKFRKIEFPFNPFIHQRDVFENIYDKDILLESPTSSGKTDAVVYPIVDQILRDSDDGKTTRSIFVYPTRALLWDQFEAIKQLNEKHKINVCKINPFTSVTMMEDLFSQNKIIIVTPDIFYYWFLRKYQHYKRFIELFFESVKHIVFDEVHLYDTYMLLNLKFLIKCIKKLSPQIKVHCLSATLEHVKDYLQGILDFKEISGESYTGEIETVAIDMPQFDSTTAQVRELLESAGRKVIIINSAKRARDAFNQLDMWYDNVYYAVGQRYQTEDERNTNLENFKNKGDGILVASPIVEQGVNFKANVIISEDPFTLYSIIQRFGRVGRNGINGKFIILTSKKYRSDFYNKEIEISRDKFEQALESSNRGRYYNLPLPEEKEMMNAMLYKIYTNSKLKETIEEAVDISQYRELYNKYKKNLPDCSFREPSPVVKLKTENLVPIWDVLSRECWKFVKGTDDKFAVGYLHLTPEEFLDLDFIKYRPLMKLKKFIPFKRDENKAVGTATLEINKIKIITNGVLSKSRIKDSYGISIEKGPTKKAYFQPRVFFT